MWVYNLTNRANNEISLLKPEAKKSDNKNMQQVALRETKKLSVKIVFFKPGKTLTGWANY